MYLRISTVRRGSRVYRYVQLVESFRRPDGKPTNRVLANLGALDDVAIANLRTALEASRTGSGVMVQPSASSSGRPHVEGNLRYLDVAVLLELWRELGLGEVIGGALPVDDRAAPTAAVVAALVLQRCVAPGSKLAAERWYPTTALPELQEIAPRQFNNSRIHRALEALEAADTTLQARLASTLRTQDGAFTALFIDATNTWFVGHGPSLAAKARDKEGVYRRLIGIVMTCDQRGYPLRWHTLSGKYHDPTALLDMAREVAALPWARGVPVVLDRAAGKAGATETLHASGLHYVTALPDPELESSGVPIPWVAVDALSAETSNDAIATRLREAGFSEDDRGRWVLDLGVFDKAHSADASRTSTAVAAMRLLEAIEAGPSPKAVAARMNVSTRLLRRHGPLRALVKDVRQRLLTEDADRLGFPHLLTIGAAPPEDQSARLDHLLSTLPKRRHSTRTTAQSTYPARGVVVISPDRLVEERQADEAHVQRIEELVADMNRRLAHPSNQRTDASALAEIEQGLRRFGLGGVFRVLLTSSGSSRRIRLEKDERAWARRRRGDGINVIIAHPDVTHDAHQLVRLYFARDAIERDFRVIKSVVELRPVHHRTDPKVRAHVSICVLAVLLLRALERRLEAAGLSASAALEALEPIRLNLLIQGKTPLYTVTRAQAPVHATVETLGYAHLLDDARVGDTITPR